MKILYLSTSLITILLGSLSPALALDTSQTCDTRILPPLWPSSHIYITDTNESLPYVPSTYHTAIFHDDDVRNTSTQPRVVQVTLTIQDQNTGRQVFNQTQSVQMQACSGPESVKWRFVPIQVANYIATVSDNRGNVRMDFNSMLNDTQSQTVSSTNYIATVSDNRGNVRMGFYSMLNDTQSQTVSSPLEQLRFGIDSHNVVCKQNLQLVMKSEDGSPACIRSDTVSKLVERGWIKLRFATGIAINSYTPISNETEDQTVKIVEIKMVPPYTPGGPVIQLTIQNVGTTPITNLNAILETNHNYTFNFKSITSSTPLISGNSRSDTTMLVGGGFQTESTYSLIISGMKDNMPFEYLEKVRIQG
ncbi:hypothetical protein DYY66_2131 [Candidatus Nitrosotalea sp. FS]|nr:hypothetical protein [Candidatus Nitrosotalea sp. FS]